MVVRFSGTLLLRRSTAIHLLYVYTENVYILDLSFPRPLLLLYQKKTIHAIICQRHRTAQVQGRCAWLESSLFLYLSLASSAWTRLGNPRANGSSSSLSSKASSSYWDTDLLGGGGGDELMGENLRVSRLRRLVSGPVDSCSLPSLLSRPLLWEAGSSVVLLYHFTHTPPTYQTLWTLYQSKCLVPCTVYSPPCGHKGLCLVPLSWWRSCTRKTKLCWSRTCEVFDVAPSSASAEQVFRSEPWANTEGDRCPYINSLLIIITHSLHRPPPRGSCWNRELC